MASQRVPHTTRLSLWRFLAAILLSILVLAPVAAQAASVPRAYAGIVVDAKSGSVVAGGNLQVGEATVSHADLTVSIGLKPDSVAVKGDARFAAGVTVQAVAAALHGMQATAAEVAAIFTALRDVGAISAEVIVR